MTHLCLYDSSQQPLFQIQDDVCTTINKSDHMQLSMLEKHKPNLYSYSGSIPNEKIICVTQGSFILTKKTEQQEYNMSITVESQDKIFHRLSAMSHRQNVFSFYPFLREKDIVISSMYIHEQSILCLSEDCQYYEWMLPSTFVHLLSCPAYFKGIITTDCHYSRIIHSPPHKYLHILLAWNTIKNRAEHSIVMNISSKTILYDAPVWTYALSFTPFYILVESICHALCDYVWPRELSIIVAEYASN